MRSSRWRLLALVLTALPLGCGLVAGLRDWEEGDGAVVPGQDGATDTSIGEGGPNLDGGLDAQAETGVVVDAGCPPTLAFGAPVVLTELDSPGLEGGGRLSPDELHIYFSSNRAEDAGSTNLMIADRTSFLQPFGAPRLLPNVNNDSNDYGPAITGDGLTLFFTRETASAAIYRATRTNAIDPFGAGSLILDETPTLVFGAFLTEDGARVYFAKRAMGGQDDLFVAPVPGAGSIVGATAVSELNVSANKDTAPVVSRDELTIYFASDRPAAGKVGSDLDVWVARRAVKTAPWNPPQRVVELASAADDIPSFISADDCRLYLFGSRQVPGGGDPGMDQAVWLAQRGK